MPIINAYPIYELYLDFENRHNPTLELIEL
jgi:hypothetical protein